MAERFGKGNVERIGNLWVLRLKGTSFERGLQHGTLMRYRVRDTLSFYRTLPETIASRSLGADSARLRAILRLKRSLVKRYARNRDPDALEETRGLAVGLGMEEDEITEALVLADVLQVVGAMAERRRRGGPPALPGLGCTTAVRRTPESLLFARNFDFWGAGYWDSNPAIIFHHPDRGKAFCSISTAGFPTAGVTSINEDGLAVAVHQHGSRDSSTRGVPILDIAHAISRKASCVDEAVELAMSVKATGGWTIVTAGGTSRDAAAIEMSSAGVAVRRAREDMLVATNVFEDEGLLEREIAANVSSVASDHARKARARDLASSSGLGPSRMASLLGDHFDPLAGVERSAGFTISRVTNLSSVLLSLDDRRFWVAEGTAPTSKGGFVGFDLDAELGGERSAVGRLEGAGPPHARTTAAQDRYLEAYKQYVYSGDLNQVHTTVSECAEIDPGEPTFHFMEGLLRAMLGNGKGSLASIETALELEKVEAKRMVELLWKARVLDLTDRRGEARSAYEELLGAERCPPIVARSAARGRKRAYREKALAGVLLDFANGDTFE